MTSAEHDFRKIHFKSPETVDRRWLDWFRDEFSQRMFQSDVETDPDAPFWLDATTRLLPDLALYIGGASPMRTLARPEAIEGETVGLTIVLAGEVLLQSHDTELVLNPGAAAFGRPVDLLGTRSDTRLLSVRLSPRLLAPLVPNLADLSLVSLPADAQPMRLLICYLNMLNGEETIETPEAGHLAALHVHDLAALALGSSRDATAVASGRGKRAGRLAAIKQDILAHLDDPDLSVAKMAARQALSPRYFHKLFELEGATYSEFVASQRLARAHRMLVDPRYGGQSISTIALGVGFGDISYFNRTFRRRFGMTPSDVRAAARHAVSGGQ
jgi:AraC-like DNA-binding protein